MRPRPSALPRTCRPTAPQVYEAAAHAASSRVICEYSTSFNAAARLLAEPVRGQVRDVYAMVRVADELVDGAGAHLPTSELRRLLNAYEAEVLGACERGFSTDLVVHAFAATARGTGIGSDLITPFFTSMRADLETTTHDVDSLNQYVYGSAEVVGLMCLRAFLAETPDARRRWDRLAPGARRLGAAFQKVNFLRDLAADTQELGRAYLPGVDPTSLDEGTKARFVAEIDADLAAADKAIRQLPDSSRTAVRAAHLLFGELNRTIARTPAAQLARRRVRVSDPRKAVLLARAAAMEKRVSGGAATKVAGRALSTVRTQAGAAARRLARASSSLRQRLR